MEGGQEEAKGSSSKRRKTDDGGHQGGRPVLTIPVESEELDAAEVILRCM